MTLAAFVPALAVLAVVLGLLAKVCDLRMEVRNKDKVSCAGTIKSAKQDTKRT